jgi:hypothetical protein
MLLLRAMVLVWPLSREVVAVRRRQPAPLIWRKSQTREARLNMPRLSRMFPLTVGIFDQRLMEVVEVWASGRSVFPPSVKPATKRRKRLAPMRRKVGERFAMRPGVVDWDKSMMPW